MGVTIRIVKLPSYCGSGSSWTINLACAADNHRADGQYYCSSTGLDRNVTIFEGSGGCSTSPPSSPTPTPNVCTIPIGNACASDDDCCWWQKCGYESLGGGKVCKYGLIAEDVCYSAGYFLNFLSDQCETTPQTQLQCDTANWYWNFTNGTCVDSPAIGMCGGGPDWGNYSSTGCYLAGLGIYGGICNRSNGFISRCYGDYDNRYCGCTGCDWCGGSPIVISTNGNQFDMTDVAHGVLFDLNANGTRDKISWTEQNADEAWLALDRNHNGVIDSGKELFGNFTFQTEPGTDVEKNGFLALAEYDKPENGGNNDGVIDAADAVFLHLRLWRDANQNGISEASELTSLANSQIESISLRYRESRRTDRYGNVFRYRAKVYGPQHSDLGRWAYDVFLKSEQ